MVRLKVILHILLSVSLLAGLAVEALDVHGQGIVNTSNQYTQVDTVNTNWQDDQTIPDSYQLIAENSQFQLHFDKTLLAFIVVDKRSGYVWHSGLDETIEGDRLNKSWRAFAKSGISIDYLDTKAVSKRISITNSTTVIDTQPIDQGIMANVTFSDFMITVGVQIKLESTGVSVEVPFTSIVQASPDYRLGAIYMYPFFGATRADSVPGYMFIPDGSGALIRFSAETKANTIFAAKYYGVDLGMLTSLTYDPTIKRPISMSTPIFGMVHGYQQNGFVCVIEKGASYGELQAHPSGIITNFNFLYNVFTYNQSYFQATNRSGDGVTILQPETNAFDVQMHYRFLTGNDSDYVGMAKSYQQYLLDIGWLKKTALATNDIGIRLEFLGGEKEKILLWYRLIAMTTINQMASILGELNIKRPEVIFFGWQPLGAASMPPTSLKVERGLGSLDDLRALISELSTDGGNLYLYLDPQAAVVGQGGYSPRNDLAMSITDSNLQGWNRSGANYFFNVNALQKRYSSFSKDVFNKLNTGLALDGIGMILYSDFKNGNILNREATIQKYQGILAENQGSTAFYQPNDYLFQLMKAYYDIPLTNNGYIFTTDAVPFIQIVLAGYVPYYGPALNFSSNLPEDKLRMADYGVYPSYFLTQEVTAKILNTRSNWIYSSSISQWAAEINTTYRWLNALLGPVQGQPVTSRHVLQEGVVATAYANGKQIIVNYSDQPFSFGNTVVNSQNAVLTEVLP